MPRATDPQVSFADWEMMQQGIALDPLLAAISDVLEQHQELIEQLRVDLQHGLTRPEMGRDGLTPPQVLRSLVLMRVKNWNYRELRERIADGYTLRCFTHFYAQPVPEHHAFNRAFNRLTPAVLQFINELVVQAAVATGRWQAIKSRYHGRTNRCSSSYRQRPALGYGARDHPSGATSGRNDPTRYCDISQSQPRRQASLSRDPTHDQFAATNTTHRKIP